jgi:hypothetical protein
MQMLTYTGAHLPTAVPPMSVRPPEAADPPAAGKRWGTKKVLWAVLFLAMVAYLGSNVAVIAYVRFGGQAVKDFCSQELIGKPAAEARRLAAKGGLEVAELEGMLRVSTDLSMSRHTCDIKLGGGEVKSARAFFRF